MADVHDVLKSSQLFKEHDRSHDSMLIYGYGDGGGGPTPEMLEQLARMTDVDGLPRVAHARYPSSLRAAKLAFKTRSPGSANSISA